MASDLSSGCTEVIEIFDEKEEGEISLEDVSSSEEGQLNDGCNSRRRAVGQCPCCLSTKHCASWCTIPTRRTHSKSLTKKDAVQEKENCHHTKDSGYSGSKHPASTLQENNNDLIPISSDSDMEIVGLADNVKPPLVLPQAKTTKVRKRRRKRRSQNTSVTTSENLSVLNTSNITDPEFSLGPKRDPQILKDNHLPRAHRRESNSPHKISSGLPFTRSRIVKSPLRRHRSPFGRARSPVLRKSPIRRPRSPVSPLRSPARRQLRSSLSPSNPTVDMDGNVNKLLKKVRHLKSVGTHSANRNSGKHRGRGPSLKDKLNNMMKNNEAGDNAGDETAGITISEKKLGENVDDEEDLALLRKMALETKPKWNVKTTEAKEEMQGNNNIGDDDVEDLELRMIALRSAMLKKHQDRMQRGVVPGKTKRPIVLARSSTESPFSQSFLDSIPIPGEENEKEKFKTPLRISTEVLNENTNPEDMELDSEVELEGEKGAEPYSPTDEISRQINIDSELLGIQPSDVSFITPISQVPVVSTISNIQTSESDNIDIIETGASYLPSIEPTENYNLISTEPIYYSNTNVLPNTQSPTSLLYSPNNGAETLENHFSTQSEDTLTATPYSPSQPIETPTLYYSPENDPFANSDPNRIPDTPYSPTDTPIYDPELNNPSLSLNHPPFQELNTLSKAVDKPAREKDIKKRRKTKPPSALIKIKLVPNLPKDIDKPLDNNIVGTSSFIRELSPSFYPENLPLEKDNASETSSMKADVGSALNSSGNSPDGTMIVVDELPETDLDGSPLVPVSREIQDLVIHIPATLRQQIAKVPLEPLYLLGVPDVTKDANKIPTLVNRSLVPASILKSNKNLQQPLPPKKIEAHLEPAFKSAEMQPVQISNETTKANRLFKPIKLAPVMKKPQLRIVTPAAFNCSSNDNSILEEQGEYKNVKSVQEMSKNEAEDLENERAIQALNKMWEMTDLGQSESCLKIVQPVKTLALPHSEPRTNIVHDRARSNDTYRVSNRKSSENLEVNFVKEKKPRSRRSKSDKNRSKHVTKTVKEDKSMETKDTAENASKLTMTEGTACIDISSLHKQTSNSNKTSKKHIAEESAQKKRNSRDKLKKMGQEKNKRDKEERRDRRSIHKYDKISNNYKRTDANKPDDRRMKKQQHENIEALEGTEIRGAERRENYSMNKEDTGDNSTVKQPKAALNIDENTANDQRSDSPLANITSRKSSELNKTTVNIANAPPSCNVETNSVEISDLRTENAEDSTPNNVACKKVEASKRRRSSLDDDEEALRAILLASLAKRSKPSEPVNTTSKTTPLENLSYTSGNTSTESVKGLPTTPGAEVPVSLVYSSSSDATPPSLANNNSTLSNSVEKNTNLGTLPTAKIADSLIAENTVPKKSTSDLAAPSVTPLRKRSISAGAKTPLKKIAKKVPISASTKVVNNAKKYQNTLVQKKLNLQKVAMISNAAKTMNRTNLHNNKIMDGGRTRSMITQPLSDTQRFVINLASDSESENETETLNKNVEEPVNTNRTEQKPVLAIPMSEFEKSVDLFLKDVRKKQETAAAIKPSSTTTTTTTTVTQKPLSPVTSVHRKSPILSTTPLAVRHLPVSLQEEYRRLKQQILEREKLKLYRVLANNTSPLSPTSKSSGTPPGPLSPASPILSPTISKQTHNITPSCQSLIATVPKDNSPRSVSVQSNVKHIVSSTTTRVSPIVSKANAPPIPSVSSLSIQIPNETTNVNLAFKKSNNSYIPVSNSQTRLVTAVKTSQDILNTKDSKDYTSVSVKDQISLKNVQVQLQQGKTGRRVSLGETLNLSTKTVVTKNKETEAQESAAIKASGNIDSNRTDKKVTTDSREPTIDPVHVREECDNSVNSSASTIIISRDEGNAQNSNSVDSSTSTVIITRNENLDSSRLESISSEGSNVNSPISKSSIIGQRKSRNNTETWEKIRGDVRKELDTISALPSSEQKTYLATVEQNLVKKRYAILDDLSEISGNLRQLEMEREVQSNMALEVRKLQEQLKIAEERLQAQRSRVNKMVPNITAAYEKFNNGRRECVKMTRICLGLGCLVIGATYKIPAAGAQLLNNRLKQVAGCTRQLSSKKMSVTGKRDEVQSKIDIPSETSGIENCLNSPISESTQSIMNENSTQKSEDVAIEDPKNSDTQFADNMEVEAEKIDSEDQETLKSEETMPATFVESISLPLTSTPNSSKDSSTVTKHVEEPGVSSSTFVLDNQGAGLSVKKDCPQRRRVLKPYKSVLNHLTVTRTTDPSGILCPYELMGTCRDEECQFVHQSARNG